jgi:hypothetical protein
MMLRDKGSLDVTPDMLGPTDMVFIDGDHFYDGITHDTKLAAGSLRGGSGVIIWHDDLPWRGCGDVSRWIDDCNLRCDGAITLVNGFNSPTGMCFRVVRAGDVW